MADPLKVCLVTAYDLAEEGGVKRHVMHLAAQLRLLGDHVDVVGPYSGRSDLPSGVYGFRGVVNIPNNGSDNRLAIFACPYKVRRFLHDGAYDIVHVMSPEVPSLPWYAAWFAGSAALIATFHAFAEQEPWVSRLARRLLCTPQLLLFDSGIAVSPAAERFARGAWSRPLALIPNGVDTSVFSPSVGPHPSVPVAGKAGEPPDGPIRLLFVGHFRDPRKGLRTLLAAFSALRARGTAVTLDVVGEGDHRTFSPAEGVIFHGPVASEAILAQLYRACDIFVAPSTGMESFGIVLLEAMGCARPIVCSDIEGYRNVVPADGALLVPPGNVERLIEAIAALSTNQPLRRKMGEANRKAVLAYDWSQLAAAIRLRYVDAIDRRGGGQQVRMKEPAPVSPTVSWSPAAATPDARTRA